MKLDQLTFLLACLWLSFVVLSLVGGALVVIGCLLYDRPTEIVWGIAILVFMSLTGLSIRRLIRRPFR